MASTLTEYLDSQQELEKEAALALPFSFSQCTYSRGHIRQAVYLCLTCASRRGICSSCSIACHTDHEQVELFPKRKFRCDCPTSALAVPCSLHQHPEAPNEDNEYGQNFDGKFCRCDRPYDAKTERETMIQCLTCEDWFHESCLNLRTRPPSRCPSPAAVTEENGTAQAEQGDDSRSDASSSGLPLPLITAGDYDSLVCKSCVSQIPILQAWAGTPGALMVVRDGPDSSWRIIGVLQEDDVVIDDAPPTDDISACAETSEPNHTGAHIPSLSGGVTLPQPDHHFLQGKKRGLFSPSPADGPSVKRSRTTGTAFDSSQQVCFAPTPHPFAQSVLSQYGAQTLGAGDIFLSGDWRKRWCRCDSCYPGLRKYPYLFEEEETYEPPEDPDSQLSLEELGLRALERLPRDRALDGIRAFNTMRDDLKNFLRPFAQEGREVAEVDVRRFFETRAEAAHIGQKQ